MTSRRADTILYYGDNLEILAPYIADESDPLNPDDSVRWE